MHSYTHALWSWNYEEEEEMRIDNVQCKQSVMCDEESERKNETITKMNVNRYMHVLLW